MTLLALTRFHYYGGHHVASGFGTMLAHAAVHATVWMLLRQLFHALGPWGSVVVGIIILSLAWRYLSRGRYA